MKNIVSINWFRELDSTNDTAKSRIGQFDNLSVLAAESQTKGRGQRGNTWLAEAGMNLTFSIILKFGKNGGLPALEAVSQFILSQITSVCIVDFLARYGIDARIKWPNDIYVNDRKICGILIENSLKGKEIAHSVIGIGLNVNQMTFAPEIHPEPTSVRLESGKDTAPAEMLEKFMESFASAITRHTGADREIVAGQTRMRYNSLLWRKNEVHAFRYRNSGETFTGKIQSVSPAGLLSILTCTKEKEGKTIDFAFNEIAYIL